MMAHFQSGNEEQKASRAGCRESRGRGKRSPAGLTSLLATNPRIYAIGFESHCVGFIERARDTQRHGSCRVCKDLAETAACRTC
jgi:hypothetical protein